MLPFVEFDTFMPKSIQLGYLVALVEVTNPGLRNRGYIIHIYIYTAKNGKHGNRSMTGRTREVQSGMH